MLDIYEATIKQIIINDPGSARIIYDKLTPESEVYEITNEYSDDFLDEGMTYCPLCGAIFDQSVDICPDCNGEGQQYLNMSDVKEIIMMGLVQDCEVIITFFDGHQETLKL